MQAWAATHDLDRAGIEIFFPDRTPPFRKLHHKLMVIDETIMVAGSFNYTAPANEYNDENIFVLGSPKLDLQPADGGPVDPVACAEIAASSGPRSTASSPAAPASSAPPLSPHPPRS